jgi:hypothetical protein
MSERHESVPVVLELAPLPREQIGPFFLLGLEKDADGEQIESSWAKRVIGARKKQFNVALEEINWAREELRDPERRARADAASLNVDTSERVLARLEGQYAVRTPAWLPQRPEIGWSAVELDVPVPAIEEVRGRVRLPALPAEPSVAWLLDEWLQQPIDPWAENLLSAAGTVADNGIDARDAPLPSRSSAAAGTPDP